MKKITFFLCVCGLVIHAVGQTPATVPAVVQMKSRTIQIKKGQTLLNLPVNPAGRSVRMRILSDGKPLELSNISLSDSPAFWTFFDVSDYQGKSITVEIEAAQQGGRGGPPNAAAAPAPAVVPELDTKALDMIFADTKYPGQDSVYKEKNRPQIHYTSQRGHMNDPNGLVYYNGEYHLFHQHNPYGATMGNQHWGHAVSKDMIHWVQLKEAVYPFFSPGAASGRGDLAFSGSATYDPKNTTGFRRNGIDPLILFYTSTGRGECIKMSYDNGRTFEDYAGNPILKHKVQGRDPKILWYAPGNHWVMVVWDAGQPGKLSNGQEISLAEHSIYTSPDMKTWTYQSGVSGFFECPDLFELPVEGEPGNSKWVLHDASGKYVLGSFDGKKFKVEQQLKEYSSGRNYYAAQTFNNSPDGRRVQIGWGTYTFPGMPFNQTQHFPNELKLRRTYDGIRLTPSPIKEIASLYKTTQIVENKLVTTTEGVSISVNPDAPIHVIAEFEQGDAPLSLNIMGYEFRYDNIWTFTAIAPPAPGAVTAPPAPGGFGGGGAATANNTTIRYINTRAVFKIEAIVDKNILEVFVNDGEVYFNSELRGPKTGKITSVIDKPYWWIN